MTLPQALARLHAAGLIASPWKAGMLGTRPCHSPPERVRVLLVAKSGPSVWAAEDLDEADGEWLVCTDRDDGWPEDAEPDTTDPCTVGGLLALLREALGDPHAECSYLSGPDEWRTYGPAPTQPAPPRQRRQRNPPDRRWYGPPAPSEGAAIEAALIALADALP